MVSTDRVGTALDELRLKGDCQLRACKHVSDGFLSIPPHRVGIAHLTLRPRFLLGDPVGCGKTPQGLVSLAYLKEKDPTLRALVITDKSALYQWKEAVEQKFMVGVTASVVGYDEKKRSAGRDSRQAQWTLDNSDVLITTWQGMANDLDVLLRHFDNFILIGDEIQRVRTHTTKTHASFQRLAQKARYTWGLSATPVYNRPEDVYGVFEAIWPGFFGPFKAFEDQYVKKVLIKPKKGRWFKKVVGYKNLEHLAARIRPYYLKRPAHVINAHLPSIEIKEVRLDMLPKQRIAYDEIVQGRVLGDKQLTKLTALCYAQMASDAPAVLPGFEGVKSSKMDELLRIIAEDAPDDKIIVYARYEKVVSYIAGELKAAGIKHVRITGKESTKAREDAKAAFNDPNSGVNIIVINSAGSQAIDLQIAGIVVCYDLPWSWGELQQVIGRARRIGSKHSKVLVILLACAHFKSIDDHTLSLLKEKEGYADIVLDLPDSELTFAAPAAGGSIGFLFDHLTVAA